MEKTVQAIYEKGVLRPLEPLSLQELQFVTADQKLCRVAALEGFATLNPQQPSEP